jgi:Class II Aldolase and Adducin N-terminal domain/DNA / pantothenate metabolism flavoprotein
MKTHHIIGGGTVFHVRPHFALCAPAYGKVAIEIQTELGKLIPTVGERIQLHLTRMAYGTMDSYPNKLETNDDISRLIDEIVADPDSGMVFMSAALCDFTGHVVERDWYAGYGATVNSPSGKDQPRLKTDTGEKTMILRPAEKIIRKIRQTRKDIFLVGFKTTTGEPPDTQYMAGLKLLKSSSCNLVLANDLHTKLNMVITPEQARYHETTNRDEAIRGLVEMAARRSSLHFTRARVVPGDAVSWTDPRVPASLRTVVDYCIERGAYKPFMKSTVGHFAVKVDDKSFLTSRRKTDFNKLNETGLVFVEADGTDSVIAHGSKPSVGGQSQRIIFREHPEVDCIVHFHCPRKDQSTVQVRSQREFECGSHECGKNTSDGLTLFGNVKAVMLDQHGPNIVFNRNTDPQEVINFIESNFDLTGRTDNVKEWQQYNRLMEP